VRGSVLAKAYAAIVRPRAELSLQEATELLRIAFGEETLAQKRARAGRAGGKRSVDVRRSGLGTAQPRSTVRSDTEADAEADAEALLSVGSTTAFFSSLGAAFATALLGPCLRSERQVKKASRSADDRHRK
jgi:hypothetical protein